VYAFGPQAVSRLGVVTGGGQNNLLEAIARGCDTFLTGEVGEPTQGIAQEEGVNFIAAGHHNTEKIGVQALGRLLQEQFGVETFFCDVPNSV
jgi:putative NIF3 family GTP cyclohydrolase 1 type 2